MLTWENTPIQGTAAIMEKLQVRPTRPHPLFGSRRPNSQRS